MGRNISARFPARADLLRRRSALRSLRDLAADADRHRFRYAAMGANRRATWSFCQPNRTALALCRARQ